MRSNTTIAGTVSYRCNYHSPDRVALVSPSQGIEWTYGELWGKILQVAGGMTKVGFSSGGAVVSDETDSVANLLLQMAAAHNGMIVAFVDSEEQLKCMESSVPLQGAVFGSSSSFLKDASIPGATVDELQNSGGKAGDGAVDRNFPLAYYNQDVPTTNRQVYLHGVGIAGLLEIKPDDQVCLASSLTHSFGVGSAIAALVRSASIYVPTAEDIGESSLLIADAERIDALGKGAKVRGGLVKTMDYRSDDEVPGVAPSKIDFGGVRLHGLTSDLSKPLFDPCKDTYWPVA